MVNCADPSVIQRDAGDTLGWISETVLSQSDSCHRAVNAVVHGERDQRHNALLLLRDQNSRRSLASSSAAQQCSRGHESGSRPCAARGTCLSPISRLASSAPRSARRRCDVANAFGCGCGWPDDAQTLAARRALGRNACRNVTRRSRCTASRTTRLTASCLSRICSNTSRGRTRSSERSRVTAATGAG